MNTRSLGYTTTLIPLLLLLGIFFPLLLYILPLLFYFAIVCLFAKPRAEVPIPGRDIRDTSSPRGPPRFLPSSQS
jgi:hypothetical protein